MECLRPSLAGPRVCDLSLSKGTEARSAEKLRVAARNTRLKMNMCVRRDPWPVRVRYSRGTQLSLNAVRIK